MRETAAELHALQALIDRSHARTKPHMRGIIHPTVQYPAEVLKTETSRTPVPIPTSLALEFSAHVQAGHSGELADALEAWGRPLACHLPGRPAACPTLPTGGFIALGA